jgi:hypothetical protein
VMLTVGTSSEHALGNALSALTSLSVKVQEERALYLVSPLEEELSLVSVS